MRCVFTLFFCAVALNAGDLDLKERPVSKVINLLKDMQAQLQKEADTDEEVYDKVACWCETNDKEKTAAIDEAQRRITDLTSTIEEMTAKSASLNTDIKGLKEDIAKNEKTLAEATSMRQKELAEFNAEEKDLMQSVQALGNAIVVLSKHHESPGEALASLRTVLRHHFRRHHSLLQQMLSPTDRKTITAFVQQPAGYQSYAPQSGQIFGILKQMKETFESNLSTAQKEELAAQASFAELKAAKEAELAASNNQLDMKTVELASTDEKNAQAKSDLEDTRDALTSDQRFLLDLKEKCRATDAEWEARQKTRTEEIAAVGEAISILSDDDAHDTFGRTLGFVQINKRSTSSNNEKRAEAAKLIKEAAVKTGNADLALFASTLQLDAFTKVKAAIDEMVAALKKEKADEIKHRDFCNAELHENEKSTMVNEDQKSDLQAKIGDLAATMDSLTKEIGTLNSEIAEMQVQMKRASEDRELENKDFQQTVADQRATQAILNKALDRLKQFYQKASLVQVKQEPGAEAPPPPPGFTAYKNQGGSTGVISLLEQIIGDTKALEAESVRAEQDSQTAYESFIKNSNDSIAANQKAIVNRTEEKARAEMSKSQAEEDLKSTMTDLENLSRYNAELHGSCDFVLKNFEVRQTARDQEIEALGQAKAILSGSDFQ